MKLYRLQARYKGFYLSGFVNANTDEEAQDNFAKAITRGEIKPMYEGFYTHNLLTYEEVNDATKPNGVVG